MIEYVSVYERGQFCQCQVVACVQCYLSTRKLGMTFYLIEGNIGKMHSLEKRVPVTVLVVNGPVTSIVVVNGTVTAIVVVNGTVTAIVVVNGTVTAMDVVTLLSEDCPFLVFRTSTGIVIAAAIRTMPTMDTRIQIRFLIRATLELLEQAEHHLCKRLTKKDNMYSVSRARDDTCLLSAGPV